MRICLSLLYLLLLVGCQPKEAKRLDTDFEGKIVYKMFDWKTHDMDSAEAASALSFYIKDSMICYIDEGKLLILGTKYAYQFFNPHTNKIYIKPNGNDTVKVANGEKMHPGQKPILDVIHELNTDTVLGYVCNKLVLKFENETRTYLYSPKLATNADWYKDTKMFDYDVTYQKAGAYHLSLHCEFEKVSYTMRATAIYPGKVPADIFPKVDDMPQVPFN